MPYVPEESRAFVDSARVVETEDHTAGELTYAICRMVDVWLGPAPGYAKLSQAVGAIESAKLEIYRRVVAPYEDRKQQQNGDMFTNREGQ